MISKTFSNRKWKEFKEIYTWTLKKRFGITMLYTSILFLLMPVILILKSIYDKNIYYKYMQANKNNTESLIEYCSHHFSGVFSVILSFLIVPIVLLFTLILSVQLFNYLHNKRSIDLYYSLPVGRTPLFLGTYFAGITTIFTPLVFNFLIIQIVMSINKISLLDYINNDHSNTFYPANLWIYLLWILLMSAAVFTFSVFLSICSGTTSNTIISLILINITYPLLAWLCQQTVVYILPGYSNKFSFGDVWITALSPFIAGFLPLLPKGIYDYKGISGPFALWWALFTVILFIICTVLYKKRKSENAEDAFAFSTPKIVIQFIITAAAGFSAGLILNYVTNSMVSFYLGVFFGSIVAHVIVEAIYSHGLKTLKKSLINYGVFVGIFLMTFVPITYGFFGYDTKIPSVDEIESVECNSEQYNNSSNYFTDMIMNEDRERLTSIPNRLTEPENIQKVINLHNHITNMNKQNNYPYKIQINSYQDIQIAYHMKNGETLVRYYSLYHNEDDYKKEYFDLLADIFSTKEYKMLTDFTFYAEPHYISNIHLSINESDRSSEQLSIPLSDSEKEELLHALQQDILECKIKTDKFGNLDRESNTYLSINFKESFIPSPDSRLKKLIGNYNGKVGIQSSCYYYLSDSYKRTLAVIKKYGWLKNKA